MNNPDVIKSPKDVNGGSLKQLVRGRNVHIWNSSSTAMELKHGYTKHGHGRHYMTLDAERRQYVDKAWDRRCDAARWANRNGAKIAGHWYLC